MKNCLILFTVLTACVIFGRATLSPGDKCLNVSDECPKYHYCDLEDGVCTHKDLFPEATSEEYGGVMIAIIANSVCNTGGLGAGGMVTPFLTLMNNYNPNTGIIITYAFVFGGSIGALLGILFKKNPVTGGPLIVWDIDILSIPLLLAGVPIGILLNKILAPIVVTCLLYCLLIFGIVKIGQNFLRTLRKERELFREAREAKAKVEDKSPATLGTEAQGPLREEPLALENEQHANEGAVVTQEQPNHRPEKKESTDIEKPNSEKPDSEKPHSEETSPEKKVLEVEEVHPEPHSTQIIHTEIPEGRKSHRVWVHQKHGDVVDVEDELYELGINTAMAFMAVPDLEKLVEENREIERKTSYLRKPSLVMHVAVKPLAEEQQEKEVGPSQPQEPKEPQGPQEPQMSEADKLLAEKILKRELRQFPWEKIGILFLSLAIYIVFSILMGNAKFESVTGNIEYCSGGYWGLWAGLMILEVCVYLLAALLVLKRNREKERIGWVFRPEEIRLDVKGAIQLLGLGYFAGLFGGVLALGGGLIMGPFFLGRRVPPQSLAASTCLFIVFSQFSTLIISILTGSYSAKDLMFLLFVSFGLSYFLQQTVGYIVKKTKRGSIILAILVVILVISFVINIAGMVVNLQNNKDFMTTFVSYCP